MIALFSDEAIDGPKNAAIAKVREAGGKWYIESKQGPVEVCPQIRGGRTIWNLVDAAGSLSGVDATDVKFIFGDLP